MSFAHRRFLPRSIAVLAAAALASACEVPSSVTAPSPIAPIAPSTPHFVTVPAQGSAGTLDFATWNVEWFGDAANGPTNEALQQSNVRDVIAGADADIWALEEVVSKSAFDTLVARLPGYTGLLANDPSVVNGPQYYSDFNNTEQKVALVYKTAVATVTSAQIILTQYDYDFAGRPPMEVRLTTTLNGVTQDLVVIVLHMKAGADNTSWTRRQNAAAALKSYLDTTYPTRKVIVLGDWNDDVDTSILAGSPTPYANFVADTAAYRYPTKVLSDSGLTSEVNYAGSVIDQMLVTNELLADYVVASAKIFRADQYVASYGTTTSDHYPVLTRYTLSSGSSGGGTPTPPPAAITLTTRGYKVKASARVDLAWTGATGTAVDVYRNGAKVVSPPNSGAYTDVLGKVAGTFTYEVCNTGTTTCSPASSVTF